MIVSSAHKHAMVDIESAGTGSNASVLTIGITTFDPYDGDEDKDGTLHLVVPFAMNAGRDVSLDTVQWWVSHVGQEAQHAAWVQDREPGLELSPGYIFSVMASIFDQVDNIWANDPDFDCDILKHFFEQHGRKWAWYRKHRSVRTLKAMFDVPFIEPVGASHNALDDCKYQARIVRAVYQGHATPMYLCGPMDYEPPMFCGVDMGSDERSTPLGASSEPVMHDLDIHPVDLPEKR